MEELLVELRRGMLSEYQSKRKKSSGRVEAECHEEARFGFLCSYVVLMS